MTRRCALIEGRLEMKLEKRARRMVGPPRISGKRAGLVGNAAPGSPGADGRAQTGRFDASSAREQGILGGLFDESYDVLSRRATIRELSARFPAGIDAFTALPSPFLDDKGEIIAKPGRPLAQTGRFTARRAGPTAQRARLTTQKASARTWRKR
jgi:hypothetical protein